MPMTNDPSPKNRYLSEIKQGILWEDHLQHKTVDAFERLYQQLQQPRKKWFFLPQETYPGIYVYGSVGRGKTHLMDIFYDTLGSNIAKKRQHYHEFMLWLHSQLRSYSGLQNPLETISLKLSENIQVLCLDEFLVNDIADAMLLAGLLKSFSKNGISLVTTSNVKPDDLYKGGLQRAKFVPAIHWINANMQIMHLDGEKDYRRVDQNELEHWYYPLNQSSSQHIQNCFKKAVGKQKQSEQFWMVNDRQFNIIKSSDTILWCNFFELCEQARSASDYLVIAKRIKQLYIDQIPQLGDDDNDKARRFITLIDILYDENISVVATAACHYPNIYQGKKLVFEFKRAASRLAELLK